MSNWFKKSAAPIEEIGQDQTAQPNPTMDPQQVIESDPAIQSQIAWFVAFERAETFYPNAVQQLERALENAGITNENIPEDLKGYLERIIQ